MENREKFGSKLGFILVSAGCAIGLGNVWKFPYMVGSYGGAAFILIYLLFLVILGLPILICEFGVGRASQRSIATGLNILEPKDSNWHKYRFIGMGGNYLIVMFYTMVGGWMLNYCYKSFSGSFQNQSPEAINNTFSEMLSNPGELIIWTLIILVLSFLVCGKGLKNGVEKISKVMMIALLTIMVILAFRSSTLEGASEGIKFYLVPDFDKIMEVGIGNVIFGAMSQAFFTLSIGMGNMAIFGSYIDKKTSLTGQSISIVALDTFVAVTAGFIVIPACFAYGVEPGAGPGLVFLSLPNIFAQMPGGIIWGGLFFLFLTFAAITTIIAIFENIVSFWVDAKGWTRKKAVITNAIAITLLSLPAIFGYNILSFIEPLGAGSTIMDLEDFLVSSNIQPLGSLVFLLFCSSKYGWGYKNFLAEVNEGIGLTFPAKIRFYMAKILPIAIIVIYVKGYYDKFSQMGTTMLVGWMIVAAIFLGIIGHIAFKKPSELQN